MNQTITNDIVYICEHGISDAKSCPLHHLPCSKKICNRIPYVSYTSYRMLENKLKAFQMCKVETPLDIRIQELENENKELKLELERIKQDKE